MAKMAPRALRAPLTRSWRRGSCSGQRRRPGVGGDHQGVRHLPPGEFVAAQVRRDGGGGAGRAAHASTPLAASTRIRQGMPMVKPRAPTPSKPESRSPRWRTRSLVMRVPRSGLFGLPE